MIKKHYLMFALPMLQQNVSLQVHFLAYIERQEGIRYVANVCDITHDSGVVIASTICIFPQIRKFSCQSHMLLK
jgi:hypothetical protein